MNKNRSKVNTSLRSHYRIAASEMTEDDIDSVEAAGGSVLLGFEGASKIPARYEAEDFASLCGWFVSEGSLKRTDPKHYANGHHRGSSSGASNHSELRHG